MKSYSLHADLRSVFQRLAAANANRPAAKPVDKAGPSRVQPAADQPRVEIAHVALRQNGRETRDAVT